jgi:hypothetical protein
MSCRPAAMAFVLWPLLAAPCLAQRWAADMFETRSHDFGTIARGAKAEYEFVFTNKYVEDVRVASVRTNCGCASLSIRQKDVQTYEQGAIVARINSDKFLGAQRATITVTFDRPHRAEVQLNVRVFIRGDVVFDPGSVVFGSVDQGEGAERTVTVTRHGRTDWNILEVRSGDEFLGAEVVRTSRVAGRTECELRVRLDPAAPVGPLGGHLVLVTNDARAREIPLAVEGRVVAAVSASPSTLFLGVVAPGGSVARQVVVRGRTPFRIVAVEPECDCLEVTLPADAEPKTLHLLPVRLTAPARPGKLTKTIRIRTDVEASPLVVTVQAAVME